MKTDRARVVLALAALYLIWGSTYLAIRIALEGIPPLTISGVRYVIAGAALYLFARLRTTPNQTHAESST
jgi:drug/metabolite transporter (DMT)-like permease